MTTLSVCRQGTVLLKILVSVVQFRPEPPSKPSLIGGFFGLRHHCVVYVKIADIRIILSRIRPAELKANTRYQQSIIPLFFKYSYTRNHSVWSEIWR